MRASRPFISITILPPCLSAIACQKKIVHFIEVVKRQNKKVEVLRRPILSSLIFVAFVVEKVVQPCLPFYGQPRTRLSRCFTSQIHLSQLSSLWL